MTYSRDLLEKLLVAQKSFNTLVVTEDDIEEYGGSNWKEFKAHARLIKKYTDCVIRVHKDSVEFVWTHGRADLVAAQVHTLKDTLTEEEFAVFARGILGRPF